MYTKQNFKDGDLLNAEKLNHIENGIYELEDKLANAGAVKEGYNCETLMKDATFEYSSTSGGTVVGAINGYCLLNETTLYGNDGKGTGSFIIILDNGNNIYEYEAGQCPGYIDWYVDNVQYEISLNTETLYGVSIPSSVYESRKNIVKVTVKRILENRKILVNQDGTPVAKPLVLDSTVNYSQLPFVGDEALQAILNGRQILVKVPNADGGSVYANFMPVFQYQLPNNNNNYLTLLFMKDGLATNLVTALGAMMQGGSPDFSMVYGQLALPLSTTYTETPLQ